MKNPQLSGWGLVRPMATGWMHGKVASPAKLEIPVRFRSRSPLHFKPGGHNDATTVTPRFT